MDDIMRMELNEGWDEGWGEDDDFFLFFWWTGSGFFYPSPQSGDLEGGIEIPDPAHLFGWM